MFSTQPFETNGHFMDRMDHVDQMDDEFFSLKRQLSTNTA